MTTSDETTTRKIVSGLQWSVSGVVVIAVMVLITGVPVPDWVGWIGGWYVSMVGPVALIVGMVLCWRLPDRRKWIIVPVEVFVLFCGVGLIHVQVDKAKAVEADSTRQAFLNGAEYKGALDTYNTAKAKLDALTGRIGVIPGNYTTGARENTASGDKAQTDFETAKAEWIKIDSKAPKAPDTVTAAGSFRIFGKDNADWLEALILFILAIGNEAVALALSWTPKPAPGSPQVQAQEQPREPEPAKPRPSHPVFGEQQERQATWKEYLEAAKSGRTDGKAWGREKVMELLGISDRQARKLYAECVAQGVIIQSSSPRVAQTDPQKKLGLGLGNLQ